MKILSLSCVYPNGAEPRLGLFVRARLRAVARHAELGVMAPVAWRRGAGTGCAPGARVAAREFDGAIEVRRPRWLYPPGGGWINPLCLAAAVGGPLERWRAHFRFDWLDAHFGFPDGIAAALVAARLGCRFSVTLRGSEVEHARRRGRRVWMGWALRRAGRVIAVSGNLREFALSLGVEPARVRTIANGVDTAIFHPRDRARARAQFGVPPEAPLVVSAGHLIELKGHHRIAAALGALPPETRLLIAGDTGHGASFEAQIRAAAARAGAAERVTFVGGLEAGRLAGLMSAADVLCLASSREGCPNVVSESLACGTPVVATAVGAVPELLPAERYGLVVPPGDARALETALRTALGRRWDRKAVAAWGRSRSWEAVGSEVAGFLGEALYDAATGAATGAPTGAATGPTMTRKLL